MGKFVITLEDLKKSATSYAKEILSMPVISAKDTLQHMTPMAGVAGRFVVSEFDGDIELGPYDANRKGSDNVTINSRVLETFLGSSLEDFDPNEVAKTVYGQLAAQGKELTQANIVRYTLNFFAAKLGGKLNMALFLGKRNDSGTKTSELFDGFDTITEKEITAGAIATGKGNYKKLPALTAQNAFDELNQFYEEADDVLQGTKTKLFVPRKVYNLYRKARLDNLGPVSYNKDYSTVYLENSDGLCELVPLTAKRGSKFLHLAPQSNFIVGYGDGMADEKIAVEKYHPFLVTFIATMFFGVQFRSISKEMLCVGELTV